MHLWNRTTPASTHQRWESPNINRSEPNVSNKTKHCLEDLPPWKSTKEADFHDGTTSLLVPTGEPVDRFDTVLHAPHYPEFIHLQRYDI